MPRLARWYVKSAMVYLVIGAVTAALALSQALPLPRGLLALRPLAWHLLTVGWATQLIFGVAFWMFPHLTKQEPRGDERSAWAAFWTLNIGLILRAIGEPVNALWPDLLPPFVLQASAVLQVAAVWLFVIVTWPRAKALARAE
jgi:heme/copper-type cytochrome/quinol oxidase subunit 1